MSYFLHYVTQYSDEGTNLFQNANSAQTGDVARNITFLISNYARALYDRAGRESWVSIIARPEIKTQSRRLAEFCTTACFAQLQSLSKGETPKTDVSPSANVAKFEPVAIRKRARALYFALNEPADRAMIGARDRLIVDKQKLKECICAPLL